MTPEEKEETLRLHTLLQPFYREKMGAWQVGDRFYCLHCKGEDRFLVGRIPPDYICCAELDHLTIEVIRLPLPIDPVNENRGLTGIIKHYTGIRKCTELKEPLYRVDWWTKNGPEHSVYGPTTELALLRALCKQVGVE